MADPLAIPGPEPIDEGPLAGAFRWTFEILTTESLTPQVRRLRLTAPHLELLDARPGQDLMVAVPTDIGTGSDTEVATINRRYSIRSTEIDGSEPHVVVDVVTHGAGPGARWASTVEPGGIVRAVGPRGKVLVDDDARAHLFVGDAAGAPATLSMLESVPMNGRALLIVDSVDQVQPTSAPEDRFRWLVGVAPGAVDAELLAEVATDPAAIHAYLAGERRDVARWRALLLSAGLSSEQISPKAYWSRDASNAAHGEPARQG